MRILLVNQGRKDSFNAQTFFLSFFIILLCLSSNIVKGKLSIRDSESVRKADGSSFRVELTKVKTNKIVSFITTIQTSLDNGEYSNYVLSTNKRINHNLRDNKIKIIPLRNYKNSQYIGTIQVGKPSQKIPVLFDTGSGNLWVTSARCTTATCKNQIKYNSNLSSDFKPIGLSVEVTFGTGVISGQINSDTFGLAGISIPEQKFAEIMNEQGDVFDQGNFSGILGLGYPSMSAYGITPVFDTIISDKLLKQNTIAFYFSYNENTPGEVSFGEINPAKYTGSIKYYPVIDQYYWTIKLKDILYNGQSVGLCPSNNCKIVVDSGTSLIAGPTTSVKQLLKTLPVEKDCTNYNPNDYIDFVLGNGDKYTLTIDEYVSKTVDSNNKPVCAAYIMPLDVPKPHGPAWVLGEIFMQKFYTVFNRDTNAIGFALAVHNEKKANYD